MKKKGTFRRIKGRGQNSTYPTGGRILKQSGKGLTPIQKYRQPIAELMRQKMGKNETSH
jgi:hypothetical protein